MNLISKKAYSGINTMLLGFSGFSSPFWLTYKQAKDLGGYVLPGEKSSIVVFWTSFEKDKLDVNGCKIKSSNGGYVKERIPVLRYYNVFNTEQCTIPDGKVPETPIREDIADAEVIVNNYSDCPEVIVGNFDTGNYSRSLDRIKIPMLENFESTEEYYATLFHEMIHSTAHKSRLDRKEFEKTDSAAYGKEELIAEVGAAFLAYEAGIDITLPNQASYISGWLNALNADKRLIVSAAGAATKAVAYILKNVAEEEQVTHEEGTYALL
jgi:antirestriction protein ArdC